MSFKQKIVAHCTKLLNEKIAILNNNLKELTESAANETKSTAGDKHETALAMLQLEQENVSRQLKTILDQKAVMESIDISVKHNSVVNGSLVKTNKGVLFLGVALGKIIVDDIQVIVLSIQSPLGKKLVGLKRNDSAAVNETFYMIDSVE